MANIQLFKDYGGRRTNEARIPPGVYYENDPLLCGLADYLVDNGHARFVNDPVAVVTAEIQDMTGVEMTSFPIEVDSTPVPEWQDVNTPEVVDEIEHDGRKIQRRKPKG